MTEEEAERLAHKFAEKMQMARSVSDSIHYDHHSWIQKQITKEEARTALYQELTRHVYKWGMIGVLTFILYGVWLAIAQALHK